MLILTTSNNILTIYNNKYITIYIGTDNISFAYDSRARTNILYIYNLIHFYNANIRIGYPLKIQTPSSRIAKKLVGWGGGCHHVRPTITYMQWE
jgi:hypothetical protein